MFFYLLPLLLSIANSSNYAFEDAIIRFNTVSSSPILNYTTASDTCGKLVLWLDQVYHIITTNVFQSALKNRLSNHTGVVNITTVYDVIDFSIAASEMRLYVATTDPINAIRVYRIDQLSHAVNHLFNFASPLIPSHIFYSGNKLWISSIDTLNSQTIFQRLERLDGTLLNETTIPGIYHKITANRILTIAAMVNANSEVLFIDMATYQNLYFWSPPVAPPVNVTQSISFSRNSLVAIIETDHYNPVTILDLTTFQVLHQIWVYDTIKQIQFLAHAPAQILAFCQNSIRYIDLTTGKQYSMPPVAATSLGVDHYGNNFFKCIDNKLEQIDVNYTIDNNLAFYYPLFLDQEQEEMLSKIKQWTDRVSYHSGMLFSVTQSMPFIIYILGFLNYFSLSSLYVLLNFKLPEEIFRYFNYVYNQFQKDFLSKIGINIELSELSDEKVSSKRGTFFGISTDFLPSNVVAFLFLIGNIAFILLLQFLTSFLRKKNYLRKLISKNKWEMIYGHIINLMMPFVLPWTFVMLESGVRNFKTKISGACSIFSFFIGVVFPIYYFFQLLEGRQRELISEINRKKREKERREMEEREKEKQLTNIEVNKMERERQKKILQRQNKHAQSMPSRVNPHDFDKKQRRPKQNKSVQFKKEQSVEEKRQPIRIWINTPETRAKKQSRFKEQKEQQLRKRSLQKKKRQLQKRKRQLQRKQRKQSPLSFQDLLCVKVFEQWYLCQANFLVPCLVLLSNPVCFLVVIFVFNLLGVIISIKKRECRLNSIILSIYPLVFHTCFMIFFWCQQRQIIIVVELICLATFLIGSIHHCLTLLIQIIVFSIKLIKKLCCKKNRIKPSNCRSSTPKKQQKNRSEEKDRKNMKKVTKDQKNKKSEKKVQIKRDLSAKKGKGLKVAFPDD